MRCGDCKHLDANEGHPAIAGSGQCTRWHMGYLDAIDEWVLDGPKGAVVEFDEGWGNMVGPDFGCVLFEQSTEF